MGKNRLFVAAAFIIVAVLAAVGCTAGGGGTQTLPTKLETPVLYETAEGVAWNPVSGAGQYRVSVNGVESTQTATYISFAGGTENLYSVRVKAEGQGSYRDSEWSAPVTFTPAGVPLSVPAVSHNNGLLTWGSCGAGALGYTVKINGEEIRTVKETEYRLTTDLGRGDLSVSVKAVSAAIETDSDWSATVTCRVPVLPQPEDVRIENGFLSWAEVTGADGYCVKLNGAENNVAGTSFDLSALAYGSYTLSVKAASKDKYYFDSEWTQELTFTPDARRIPAPENLRAADCVLTWDGVQDATGYTVDIDGAEYGTTDNSFDLSVLTVFNKSYQIKVKAVTDKEGCADSEWSSAISYLHREPALYLNAPLNLTVDGATLRWDSDEDAAGYTVKIDGKTYDTANNFYSLNALTGEGTYRISVKSRGDGELFMDSEYSEEIEYVYGRLPVPSNIVIDRDNYRLTWGKISNAAGYNLVIDGQEYVLTGAASNSFDLKTLITIGDYTLSLNAFHETDRIKDSPYSEETVYSFDAYASGSGTADSPYIISNAAHFQNIDDFADRYFEAGGDIDFTGFTGEYAVGERFTGSFDGKNSRLTSVRSALFNTVGAVGTVKNFSVCIVSPDSSFSRGAVAGSNSGTINNVCVTGGDIVCAGADSTALLVYMNYGSGTVSNCSVELTSLQLASADQFGGFVYSNSGKIDNSYISVGTLTTASGGGYMGGFIWNNEGSISFCRAEMDITLADASAYQYMGGFAARNSKGYSVTGTISDSYFKGKISVTGALSHVGGFVGANGGVIERCYSDTEFDIKDTGSAMYVGGFAGVNLTETSGTATFADCYSKGAYDIVAGGNYNLYFGGFYGYRASAFGCNVNFSRCFSLMQKSGWSGNYANGFAGYAGTLTASDCYFDSTLAGTAYGGYGGTTSAINYSGVTAWSTQQMQSAANWPVSYGFEVWEIKDGSYPALKITNPALPEIFGIRDRETKVGVWIDLLEGVSAVDKDGENIEVTVSGISYAYAGAVTVTYRAVDADGFTAVATAVLKIYGMPVISGLQDLKIKLSEAAAYDPFYGITAVDSFGAALAVSSNFAEISGTLGLKTLAYTAVDSLGNEAEAFVELNIYENPSINLDGNFPLSSKINEELSLADYITATDSYGETIVPEILFDNSAAGEQTVTITATDSRGDSVTVTAAIKVYGAPSISVSQATIREDSPLTADAFGVTATDTFNGEIENIVITLNDGSVQAAGESAAYTVTATDILGNTASTEVTVAVYGMPVIEYDTLKTSIREDDILTAGMFAATAKDTYGEELAVTVDICAGTQKAAERVSVRLTARSPLLYVKEIIIENVAVYGAPEFRFTVTDYELLTADLFDAESYLAGAVDSFGAPLEISVELASGTVRDLETVKVRYTATDALGNTATSSEITVFLLTDTLGFDYQGATGGDSVESLNVLPGSALGALPAPVKNDCRFMGWFTEAGGGGLQYTAATLSDGHVGTLYARWDADITFVFGTAESSRTEAKTYDTELTGLPVPGVELAPYRFAGWFTESNGGGAQFTDGMPFLEAQSLTLYAYWGGTVGLAFAESDGQFSVSVGTATAAALVIPAYWRGLPVTAIDAYGFASADMDSVFIPDTVTAIGNYAFQNCANLLSVGLSEYVVSIGASAFSGCGKLSAVTAEDGNPEYSTRDGILYDKNKTAFIHVPAAVSGDIFVPASVGVIPANVFANCANLTGIELESGITRIGAYAFTGCVGLTSLVIPASVTEIGSGIFSGCAKLINITVPFVGSTADASVSGQVHLGYFFGTGTSNTSSMFPGTLRTVTVTAATAIGTQAFWGMAALTSITLNDGISKIGSAAFGGCAGLTDIVIPDSVQEIGTSYTMGIFMNCSGLESISVPFVGQTRTSTSGYYGSLKYFFGGGTAREGMVEISQGYYPVSLRSVHITDTANIPALAFNGIYMIETVTLPEGLETIEGSVFKDCTNLKNVNFPSSLISIGAQAFGGCALSGKIEFAAGFTMLGAGAFEGCGGITEIVLPDTVTSIGVGAFKGADGLISITVPYIGLRLDSTGQEATFGAIFGIESATRAPSNYALPDGATLQWSTGSGGYYAYYWCYVPETLLNATVLGSAQSAVPAYAFAGLSALADIDLPDTYLSINENAFRASGITDISIPNVTSIASYAFYLCRALSEIVFSPDLDSIADRAFMYCSALTYVVLPAGLTTLGAAAFSDHASLLVKMLGEVPAASSSESLSSAKSIIVPAAYLTDYRTAWPALAARIFPDTNVVDDRFVVENNVILAYLGSEAVVEIPDGIVAIGANAFENNKTITKVIIPESVLAIGDYAFGNCSELASAVLPSTLNTIGVGAFRYSGLTHVSIPEGVLNIAESAFYYCDKLESVELPETLGSIGETAFASCAKLAKVIIPASVTSLGSSAFASSFMVVAVVLPAVPPTQYTSFSGVKAIIVPAAYYAVYAAAWPEYASILYSDANVVDGDFIVIGGELKAYLGSAADVVLPAAVTAIGEKVFCLNTALESIDLTGITRIGANAFYGCTALKGILIPSSVLTIGNAAFQNTSNLETAVFESGCRLSVLPNNLFYGCAKLSEIIIPDSVTELGGSVFSQTGITSIIIPDTVTVLGSAVFSNCRALTGVTFPAGMTTITTSMFFNCESLKSIEIPDTVTKIDTGAFRGSGLTHVTVPDSVTEIKGQGALGAFSNCTDLTTAVLPERITKIPDSLFYGCTSLTEITIPDAVTSIGVYAFADCTSLSAINIPAGVTSIGAAAFQNCASLKTLIIPAEVITVSGSIIDLPFGGCDNLTFYCEAQSVPSGWSNSWNNAGRPVFWGCVLSEDKTYLVSFIKDRTTVTGFGLGQNGVHPPQRAGYTFIGWTTVNGGTTAEYTFNTAPSAQYFMNVANGTLLYAVWAAN